MKSAPTPEPVMFTVAEAADLSELGARTVRTWIADGLIGGKSDQIAEEAGATTYLSVETVFALLVAATLRARCKTPPEIACKAANALAAIRWEEPSTAPVEETTLCAIVKEDGEATIVSMKGDIAAATLMDAAWVIPLFEIEFKLARAVNRMSKKTGFFK